jgi:hypothetical protein
MKIHLRFILTAFFTLTLSVCLAQGTWVKKADYPGAPHSTDKIFAIGDKIFVKTGNEFNGTTPVNAKSFWQYDTSTGVWTQMADLVNNVRAGDYARFSIKDKGYVGLGYSYDTVGVNHLEMNYHKDFWEFDPAQNKWKRVSDFPGTIVSYSINFSVNDKGYICGGVNSTNNTVYEFWEYEATADKWTRKADYPLGIAGTAFTIGNKAYAGTGQIGLGSATNFFYEYDPAIDKWTKKTNFGGGARRDVFGFSVGNKGYVGMGVDDYGNGFKDFWVYNQSLNIWAKVADMPANIKSSKVAVGAGSKGYLLFGPTGNIGDVNDIWEYTPDNLSEQKIISPDTIIKRVNDPDFDFVATSTSGLPTTYSILDAPFANIINNKIHLTGNIGKTLIVVKLAGNSIYRESTDKSTLLIITKVSQTVTLPQIIQKTYGDADFDPGATTTSGLKANYSSSNTAVAVISNGKVHITGGGTTTIKASQSGDVIYDVATDVSQTLVVNKADQQIIFSGIVTKNLASADFDPGAIISSSLPVDYNTSNANVATVVNGKIHLVGAGSTTITASQTGNNSYNAATPIIQTLTVLFSLPSSNFQIITTSVTCKGQNNGQINITAIKNLSYTATITGNGLNKSIPFTQNLSFSSLTAGSYNVCITVEGQADYKQCFDLVITEPKDLSAYVSLSKEQSAITLQLNGAANYNINLNGATYHTTESTITLPITNSSNKLTINTDKPCQGEIQQIINATGNFTPYPNPFNNVLYVNLGEDIVKTAVIRIYNLTNGHLEKSVVYNNQSGVVQLDMSKLNNGLYSLKLSLDKVESVFKIIKK